MVSEQENREANAVLTARHLDTRVDHLEQSVEALHRDSMRTQGAIAGMAAQVDSIVDTIKDIGQKLDQQRTRRPELGALATTALVVLTIGALALAPLNMRMSSLENQLHSMQTAEIETAITLGEFGAAREALTHRVSEIEKNQNVMGGNRFTKQDGLRLEDKLDTHVSETVTCTTQPSH